MERKRFMSVVRQARKSKQKTIMVLRRTQEGKSSPRGLRGLYKLHDAGYIKISSPNVKTILEAVEDPSLWDRLPYRTIEVSLMANPTLQSRQASFEQLWYWVGRHLWAITFAAEGVQWQPDVSMNQSLDSAP